MTSENVDNLGKEGTMLCHCLTNEELNLMRDRIEKWQLWNRISFLWHCSYGYHLRRIRILSEDTLNLCIEDNDTSRNLVYQYPTLTSKRFAIAINMFGLTFRCWKWRLKLLWKMYNLIFITTTKHIIRIGWLSRIGEWMTLEVHFSCLWLDFSRSF